MTHLLCSFDLCVMIPSVLRILGKVGVWGVGFVHKPLLSARNCDVAKLDTNAELGCRGGHAVYRCAGDEMGTYTDLCPDVLALGGGAKGRAVDERGLMVMLQGLQGAVMNNTGNSGLHATAFSPC